MTMFGLVLGGIHRCQREFAISAFFFFLFCRRPFEGIAFLLQDIFEIGPRSQGQTTLIFFERGDQGSRYPACGFSLAELPVKLNGAGLCWQRYVVGRVMEPRVMHFLPTVCLRFSLRPVSFAEVYKLDLITLDTDMMVEGALASLCREQYQFARQRCTRDVRSEYGEPPTGT